jgi:translocation and assembly module TamB
MNWKKIVGRTLAVLAAVIVIAVAGGYFYLKSPGFRQFALRKIVEEANQSTGGRTEIRALDFDLSTLTAHLYDVVIHGTEPSSAQPLLRIDKLTIGLKVQSLLGRKVTLDELLVEHPVVHLLVDREGNNNIPPAPPSQPGSSTNVFDLAVRHFGLSNGEVDYNDRKTPLQADLHDLRTDIAFEYLANRYQGSVSYDNGQLRYDKYAPLAHSLNASFKATRSAFFLDSAVIKIASSAIRLTASATNYSSPTVEGGYDILIHSQDLAELVPTVNTAGDVALTGKVHYQPNGTQSFLRSITVEGQMASEALSAVSSDGHLDLRKLRGHYQLANGELRASGVDAEALGGRVNADLEIRNLDGPPSSHLSATLRSISLQAAQRAVRGAKFAQVALSGKLEGTGDASWTGGIGNARARVDLTLHAAATPGGPGMRASNQSSTNIPIDGAIHASYDGPKGVLTLRQTTLRIPATTLTAEGQVSKRSHLDVRASTTDLHELVAAISAFVPGSGKTPLVAGSATLNGTVQGSLQKPQVSATVSARDLQVQGSEWKSADFSVAADPARVVVSNGRLTNAHRGSASFGATVGLRDWAYTSSSPIQANLSLRQMSLADLQHLANVHYPVSGELSAKISLNGTQLDPGGSGSLEIVNARAYDEPLKTFALNFHTEKGSIVSDLHVTTDAGAATASLSYEPRTEAYSVRLDAPAIVLQKLHALQEKNLAVNGTLALSASGQGTLEDPQLNASLQLPQLEVRQKSILGVKAELHVANKRADVTLDSQVAQATVRVRGQVALTGAYQATGSIDTTAVPLDVLFATYSKPLPQGFQGQTEVHANLKGPLKNWKELEAHITIPTLNASYQALEIGAAGPIRADYAHSVLTLQPAEIRGTGTSIRVQGSLPLAGSGVPSFAAQGSIDARVFRILSPDLQSSGTVGLDIRASGSAADPQVSGQVRLQNLALAQAGAPISVDKLNGTVDINDGRLQISNFSGEAGGGQVSVGGSVTYRSGMQFDLALQANSVRLRYPDGLRSVLDANLAWIGSVQASTLSGRILVDTLSFTPDFDLATFGDQFSGNGTAPAEPGFLDTIALQVALQSKENLSATSSQISLEGSAALHATGTAANPIITGRTDLTAGEFFYRNVRYQLQRGILTFADPNQTKPVLDVSVTTTVEQYSLTLNLRGPFDTLTTSYSSDPPLATADVINLIARGKTSSELAASSQSTDSMIASQAASQLSGSVQKLAGISSLQIDPLSSANSQNPSARVAVQQRVTKNFLFTFSTDVSQPGNEIVQGDYQINKRWSVSVARDQLGGVSIDGRYHTKF